MTVKERREKHIQALLEMRKVMLEDDGWENLKPYIEAVTSAGLLMSRFNSEDMVSVIRCRECKWYEARIKRCNNSKSTEWKPNDYCSDAERKEE